MKSEIYRCQVGFVGLIDSLNTGVYRFQPDLLKSKVYPSLVDPLKAGIYRLSGAPAATQNLPLPGESFVSRCWPRSLANLLEAGACKSLVNS